MPFGLRNAAQTFQRFMDQALRGLPFCYVYIDDLLIASQTPDEHTEHLHQVFQRLSDHGIVINPAKCVLGVSELDTGSMLMLLSSLTQNRTPQPAS
jgi:hypothetical protein